MPRSKKYSILSSINPRSCSVSDLYHLSDCSCVAFGKLSQSLLPYFALDLRVFSIRFSLNCISSSTPRRSTTIECWINYMFLFLVCYIFGVINIYKMNKIKSRSCSNVFVSCRGSEFPASSKSFTHRISLWLLSPQHWGSFPLHLFSHKNRLFCD